MQTRDFIGRLGVLCLLAACSELDDPTASTSGRAVTVQVIPDSIAADGVSRAAVEVRLAPDTPLGSEVTVSTDLGSLAGAGQGPAQQLKYNAGSRTDTLVLVSGSRPGVATVTVQTGKSFAADSVRLTAAAPDAVELATDRTRATANGQDAITATARLFRAVAAGKVSEGTRVRFDAFRDGAPVPELSGTAESAADGTATRRFTTRSPGTYQIVAAAGGRADTVAVVFEPAAP